MIGKAQHYIWHAIIPNLKVKASPFIYVVSLVFSSVVYLFRVCGPLGLEVEAHPWNYLGNLWENVFLAIYLHIHICTYINSKTTLCFYDLWRKFPSESNTEYKTGAMQFPGPLLEDAYCTPPEATLI